MKLLSLLTLLALVFTISAQELNIDGDFATTKNFKNWSQDKGKWYQPFGTVKIENDAIVITSKTKPTTMCSKGLFPVKNNDVVEITVTFSGKGQMTVGTYNYKKTVAWLSASGKGENISEKPTTKVFKITMKDGQKDKIGLIQIVFGATANSTVKVSKISAKLIPASK